MMKKTFTSLRALILAALLALPLSAYCDAAYTFYVKYTGSTTQITSPYLHLWNSGGGSTTWPGLEMTYSYIDSDGYYVYTLTTTLSFTPDYFIFDDNSGDGYYYNLQGMRLTQKPTTKGIYIHNGKKIIVR